MSWSIDEAALNDHEAIRALLVGAGLPVPDGDVARDEGRVVGCIGHERHGPSDEALLRSLAVSSDARRRGVGRALVLSRLERLRERPVYLLTISAAPFFARLGFERIERARVSDALRSSRQFAIHACDSAVVMRRPRG